MDDTSHNNNIRLDGPKSVKLVGLAKVAEMLNVTEDEVWDLMEETLPPPMVESTRGPEWMESEILSYMKDR